MQIKQSWQGFSENLEGTFFHLIFVKCPLFLYLPNTKSTSQVWIQISNVSLTFANVFQKLSLLVSAFTNEPWEENFSENYHYQVLQN